MRRQHLILRALLAGIALQVLITAALVAVLLLTPCRDRVIETAVLDVSGTRFWWPPSWRARYHLTAPIFERARSGDFRILEPVARLKQSGRSADCLPILIAGMKHSDPLVRVCAAAALKELGPVAEPAIPVLITAIDDSDQMAGQFAIQALGEIGPSAEDAVPALRRYLQDQRYNVSFRRTAARSLAKIPSKGLPALIDALQDQSIRFEVIGVLAEMGHDAQEAVPQMQALAREHPSLSGPINHTIVKIMNEP